VEAIISKSDHYSQQRFAELLSQHQGIVWKIAHSYAHSVDDREDLAQEISARLWRAYTSYDESRTFSTWMYRVALNVAISHLRAKQSSQALIVPIDEQPQDKANPEPNDGDQGLLLQKILDWCDPLSRALLILYLEDRSTREISDVLGISESNVTTKLNRLKQKLRDQFSD
jgi:RNA polymerase sigma factor (sigma-70 family)